MTVQKRNDQMIDLLATDFQRRYEPNFSVANALSTMLLLPELRGLWPFSSINESGNALDISGQGRTLNNNGTSPRGVSGLIPFVSGNGSSQYFSRADEAGLDITGSLTFGGWFTSNVFMSSQVLLSKYGSAGQISFQGYVNTSQNIVFNVSTDGTALVGFSTTGSSFITSRWNSVIFRFTPSTELAIFINGVKFTLAAGIPASIFNSTADFRIMANMAGFYFNGWCSLCFLCASALSDTIIKNVFEQSRAAFNV